MINSGKKIQVVIKKGKRTGVFDITEGEKSDVWTWCMANGWKAIFYQIGFSSYNSSEFSWEKIKNGLNKEIYRNAKR